MTSSEAVARRQVLVQLDDELLSALDAEAGSTGSNRSRLIRLAVRTWLDDRADERAERLDEQEHAAAFARQPQDPEEMDAIFRAGLEAWPKG